MGLGGQAGRSWWRSKRQSAFYLQASPVAYLAAHYRAGADDVAAGSSAQLPSLPCEPTWCVTIRRCFLVLPALLYRTTATQLYYHRYCKKRVLLQYYLLLVMED